MTANKHHLPPRPRLPEHVQAQFAAMDRALATWDPADLTQVLADLTTARTPAQKAAEARYDREIAEYNRAVAEHNATIRAERNRAANKAATEATYRATCPRCFTVPSATGHCLCEE